MIKKISILTLLIFFFVSTTGLPVTIHFCNMTEKEMSSTCSMHMPEKQVADTHSTCNEENPAEKNISIEMQDCCKTETIIASVEDSFLTSKTESQNKLLNELSPVSEFTIILIPQHISTYSFIDTSPHLLQSNKLYLTNLIFLI